MKIAYMLSALAVAATLSACANNHGSNTANQTAAPDPYGIASLSSSQQQPNVSGTINIRHRVALPPDAVLTVTLSDASLTDAPARVLSQKAVRTEGKQAPFNFVLPYNPADIKPNARILLSAAITVNGQLMFITDTVQTVINQGGNRADLHLIPVQQTAVPMANDAVPAAQ
ncbi:glycoprotein-polysaccharide metabolism protein [Klebsiella indica]|uniref:Glycoprotein-polysaccharide metabolism protein n=1 Tax=Klebsiella indica TaxID=2582917 RepID=A0A5R9LPF0_9ENTR|nr:YbaY family lipoprotein [Klebsiella indica]TLV23908.1 glycoprotein-polysaccharide metabolism protein [Klebsiella indica]